MAHVVLPTAAMATVLRRWTAVAAVNLSSIALASPAHAEITARAALDAGVFAYEHHGAETKTLAKPTGGVRGALGYAFALSPSLYLGPEVALGYSKVSDPYARNVVRGQGGVRFGWLASADFAAGVFAHFGYGRAWGEDGDATLSRTGPVFEVGGCFDYRVTRALAIGPDVIAGVMRGTSGAGTNTTPWLLGGIHLSTTFGGPSKVETDVATR